MRKCDKCPETFEYDPYKRSCVCPILYPFLQNGKCTSCTYPNYWDTKTNSCAHCPDTYIYDPETMKCKCPSSTPF